MSAGMEIYLIRHTRVAVAPGICYGQTDVALADSFLSDAEQVRAKLPDAAQVVIYSSPLTRCRRLAEQFQPHQFQTDARLLEMNFGAWEQLAWDDVGLGALKSWTADVVNERCPGGESFLDQFHRIVAFWHELTQAAPARAFVVTHGGAIRALLAHLLDMPLAATLRLGVDFGGVSKVRVNDDISSVDYVNR